jgi:anti-sigma regulatory factor (Ser/Thr protein kinase)
LRRAFRDWMAAASIEENAAAEISLAVWEACANAIEHAQRPSEPSFGLRAMLDDGGWIRVEIQDSGSWKQSEGSVDRGLGLTLMRSFMHTVDVRTEPTGTTIIMERRVDLAVEVSFR